VSFSLSPVLSGLAIVSSLPRGLAESRPLGEFAVFDSKRRKASPNLPISSVFVPDSEIDDRLARLLRPELALRRRPSSALIFRGLSSFSICRRNSTLDSTCRASSSELDSLPLPGFSGDSFEDDVNGLDGDPGRFSSIYELVGLDLEWADRDLPALFNLSSVGLDPSRDCRADEDCLVRKLGRFSSFDSDLYDGELVGFGLSN
jgi:hypothetical protein